MLTGFMATMKQEILGVGIEDPMLDLGTGKKLCCMKEERPVKV